LKFFPDLQRAVDSGFFRSAEWTDDMLSVRTAVDFVLALDNSLFSGLDIPQRYYLYEKYVGASGPSRVVSSWTSRPAAPRRGMLPAAGLEEELRRVAGESFEVTEVFEAVTYPDACNVVLMKMIACCVAVKKCACCGKLFIPQEAYGKYCDRLQPEGKTCKETGYLRRMEADPLLKLYNTAYKTRHAQKQRLIRGRERAEAERYEGALQRWRDHARRAVDECRPKFESCIDAQLKDLMLERLKAQLDEDLISFL
jgi:hypothetical protein